MSTERAQQFPIDSTDDSGLRQRTEAFGVADADEQPLEGDIAPEPTSIFTAYGLDDAHARSNARRSTEWDGGSNLIRYGISAMITIISAAVGVAVLSDETPSSGQLAPPIAAPMVAPAQVEPPLAPSTAQELTATALPAQAETQDAPGALLEPDALDAAALPTALPHTPTAGQPHGKRAAEVAKPFRPAQLVAPVRRDAAVGPGRQSLPAPQSLQSPYEAPATRRPATPPRVTGVIQDNPY